MGLSRITSKLTRKGIHCNGLYYAPEETGLLEVGDRCTVAVDPTNTSDVYLVLGGRYHRCPLTGRSRGYIGLEIQEVETMRRRQQKQSGGSHRQEIESSVIASKRIGQVIENATARGRRDLAFGIIGDGQEMGN